MTPRHYKVIFVCA